MKHSSTLSFLVALLALLSVFVVIDAAPSSSKLFRIETPEEGDVFLPDDDIYVHTETDGGSDNDIFKKNPMVKVTLQTAIPKPDINVDIDDVPYQTLHGYDYSFKAKEAWFDPERPNKRFRIRASFTVDDKFGYVDSGSFYLRLKEDN